MAQKVKVKRTKGLRGRLDAIDEKTIKAIGEGYYLSCLVKKMGMWEKGEAVAGVFGGAETPANYKQLQRETGRDNEALKKWHLLYLANPEKKGYKTLAEKEARSWTDNYFASLLAKSKEKTKSYELPEGVFLYNIWQLESRRIEGYGLGNFHGVTPVEVCLHTLRAYCPPNGRAYDSMNGSGTFPEVARELKIECDASDLLTGIDAAKTGKPDSYYDLVFNHFAYWNMVAYSKALADLSNLPNLNSFFEKCSDIFVENYRIIKPQGFYCVMIGDLRKQRQTKWLTVEFINIAAKNGFECYDNAYISTLNTEHVSTGLAEYRAKKFGYMKASVDWYLVFRKP